MASSWKIWRRKVGEVSKNLKKTEKYFREFHQNEFHQNKFHQNEFHKNEFHQNEFQQNGGGLVLEQLLKTNVCPEATANLVRNFFKLKFFCKK